MESKKSLLEKLSDIQSKMSCPKDSYNSFGKYNYRSCESILEAVKPLLGDCALTLSDEMVQIGERYYIKATARLKDGEDVTEVTAYAREAESQKGMGEAQITGSASSYARKYALNGLFLIDDARDDDTRDNSKPKNTKTKSTEDGGGYEALRKKAGLPEGQKQPLCPTCDAPMLPTKKKDGTGVIWFCKNWKEQNCKPVNVDRVDMAGNIISD